MSSSIPVPFVKKASRLGIYVEECQGKGKVSNPPLYQSDLRDKNPSGFEQINDDMYARTDNKFMVFNGAGVDSWDDCCKAITDISDAEKILRSTFSHPNQ
jgi:hypothetical protein